MPSRSAGVGQIWDGTGFARYRTLASHLCFSKKYRKGISFEILGTRTQRISLTALLAALSHLQNKRRKYPSTTEKLRCSRAWSDSASLAKCAHWQAGNAARFMKVAIPQPFIEALSKPNALANRPACKDTENAVNHCFLSKSAKHAHFSPQAR